MMNLTQNQICKIIYLKSTLAVKCKIINNNVYEDVWDEVAEKVFEQIEDQFVVPVKGQLKGAYGL